MEIIIHDLPEEKLKTIYRITDNSLVITNKKKLKVVQVAFIVGLKIQVNVE